MICFLWANKINAIGLDYTFYNLNEKDGLKNNIVFSFLKDSHGILWIGTQNGLNRFDGSHFYSFKKNKTSNSIPNSTVHSLCEDTEGNIWGGTGNGIFCYQLRNQKFDIYYANSDCHDNIITNITCNRQGDIFATTTTSLIKLNKQKHSFDLLSHLTIYKDSVNSFSIGKNKMQYDENLHGCWIATQIGLVFYEISSGKLTGSFNTTNNPLFKRRDVSALSKSKNGNLWFCDNHAGCLIECDPALKKEIRQINLRSALPSLNGSTIMIDSRSRIWLSTWSYNLLVIDLLHDTTIEQIESQAGNNYSVASTFFWASLEDENGTIWLGTPNGISMCNPGKYVYKACHLPDKIDLLKNTSIRLSKENPLDHSWWIVTADLHAIHYFPSAGNYDIYDFRIAKPDNSGQKPQKIYQISFEEKQPLFSSNNGMWCIKPSSKIIIPYCPLPDEYRDFTLRIRVTKGEQQYLTDGDRILIWNKQTRSGKWVDYNHIPNEKKNSFWINQMKSSDHNPVVWMANNSHIAYLDSTDQIQIIKLVKDENEEAGGYFQSIDTDTMQNVWVANKGVGIYQYNFKSGKITLRTELDGLTDNHLHCIKTDDMGYLWCIYFNKVSVFNPTKNSFSNFTIPYSEHNLNYFNDLTKRTDGIIMGNVYNDLFEFYPKNLLIKPVRKLPELSIQLASGITHFCDYDQTLTLTPEQNSIRFQFGILLDAALYPHEFNYFLEGSDKKWVLSSNNHEVNYNNLPSGDYIFHVKAKGKNNTWESGEKTFRIHINTPFYKSNLFLAFILLLIASAISLLYRYRIIQKEKVFLLEGKAQVLEKEKTMVMYESLKQQLNPHFLFNSLTSLSGLIETDQAMAGEFLEQMSGIYRYILKNGNSETVSLKNELAFAELYISLQQTRFNKGLEVRTNIPATYSDFKIAPVTLQNLIENAIKHNVIDSDSPLIIELFVEDDYLIVRNNLQKKHMVETSNQKGLAQFITLYQYLIDKPVLIEETTTHFIIKIPLI